MRLLCIIVELWSIYHALSIAWGKGFQKVVIESDTIVALTLLREPTFQLQPLAQLVQGIKDIASVQATINWKYFDRSVNCPVDLLAKKSFQIQNTRSIFYNIPQFLLSLLDEDKRNCSLAVG